MTETSETLKSSGIPAIPFALLGLKFFQQFVVYRVVPSISRPGKNDKLPCDYRTGAVVSAHDPQYWTDAETAQAAAATFGRGWGVGFVFTESDPFWFLDIDSCLVNGQWSQLAVRLCELLTGCAVEISQSGTGLHIFGMGKPPAHSCRNQALGLEFYSSGRFVALTGAGAVGNCATDASLALPVLVSQYFPPDAAQAVAQGWTTEPVPEWSGPTDDEELIRKALRAQSSSSAFGKRASFADLWQANESVLGSAYPDAAGRPYDASSADAALAQHLAFWTGKDCERISRIMQRSALKRDKWEREDYLPRTILGAVGRQVDVLQDKPGVQMSTGALADMAAVVAQSDGNDDDVVASLLQLGTQDSLAIIFAKQYAGRLKYDNARKIWREYDGTRWRPDDTQKTFDLINELCRKKNHEGKASMGSAGFAKGVESKASANRLLSVAGDDWDSDNYTLNMPDCTFDLRTNARRAHNPEDKLTLCTSVAPTSNGGAEFLRFIEAITCGDRDLTEYLQVSLGSCLSGAVETQGLDFWVGEGGNGKSTLAELVKLAMGGYARKIRSTVLMAKRNEAHPTEIANLQGARLALSSEVSPNDYWDEGRICEVTGDDELSARWMHGNDFTFKRTHRHIILGNYRPQLRSLSDGIRRRIRIVPFNASFVGREDRDLKGRLETAVGYILHWQIEGHRKWLDADRRLPRCKVVEEASADYFAAQSTPQLWIDERIEKLQSDGRPFAQLHTSQALYLDYVSWKKERGESPVSQTRWADCMKPFERVKGATVRYRGLRLLPRGAEALPFPLSSASDSAPTRTVN